MKTLIEMKKVYCFNRFVLFVMVLSLATTFTSCSNDDDEDIPVYSLKDVEGNYLGKMTTESAPVIPTENAGESEEPVGIEVNAEVKDNEIAINKFPVDDLIKSIIDEKGDFAYNGKTLKFAIKATKVEVGNTTLDKFPITTFNFDMSKK